MKSERKPQFRLTHNISEQNNKKLFIKSAATEDAYDFLQDVIKKEKISRHFFGDKATVISGTLRDNCIYYPYIEYPTVEQLIIDDINIDNRNFGISIIHKYISFISNLPSKECRPERFIEEFGISYNEFKKPVNCLLFGPIDCIPSNILVNHNTWYIIDHEWTYEFPIPIDFIIYRGIYSLVIHLQELIKSKVSKEHPVTLLQGYGNNRTYFPLSWLEIVMSMEIPIKKLVNYERLFQKKAFVMNKPTHLRLKNPPEKIFSIKPIPFWISFSISRISIPIRYILYFFHFILIKFRSSHSGWFDD